MLTANQKCFLPPWNLKSSGKVGTEQVILSVILKGNLVYSSNIYIAENEHNLGDQEGPLREAEFQMQSTPGGMSSLQSP